MLCLAWDEFHFQQQQYFSSSPFSSAPRWLYTQKRTQLVWVKQNAIGSWNIIFFSPCKGLEIKCAAYWSDFWVLSSDQSNVSHGYYLWVIKANKMQRWASHPQVSVDKDTDQNWVCESTSTHIRREIIWAFWLVPRFRSTAPVLSCYNTGVPSTELLV